MILHSVGLSPCLEIAAFYEVGNHAFKICIEEVMFKKVENRALSYLPKH